MTDTEADEVLGIPPLLMRVVARGLISPQTLVTRDEAMALLPSCCSRRWFDEQVKSRQVAFVGERALYHWGDIVDALRGVAGVAKNDAVPEKTRYLTIDEAAAYLRYPTTNALRMAVHRKQIVPSAKRRRALLFTREDLDRQLAAHGPQEVPPSGAASTAGAPAARVDEDRQTNTTNDAQATATGTRRREPTPKRPLPNVNDPYGLQEALARGLGAPWPPPEPKRTRRRRRPPQ